MSRETVPYEGELMRVPWPDALSRWLNSLAGQAGREVGADADLLGRFVNWGT